jgi:hypothetical protein
MGVRYLHLYQGENWGSCIFLEPFWVSSQKDESVNGSYLLLPDLLTC